MDNHREPLTPEELSQLPEKEREFYLIHTGDGNISTKSSLYSASESSTKSESSEF